MVRAVLYLLASILLITVIRAVVGVILKGFGELFRPKPSTAARPSVADHGAEPQSLKKDPVCGTFVVPSTPHRKTVDGTAYYFCSTECRNKFRS